MPNPSFKVTPYVIAEISKRFKIPKSRVENMYKFWGRVVKTMEKQYLAHVIRAMEEELRRLPGHKLFQILCTPISGASGRVPQARYKKGQYFAIYFRPIANEKQLRVELAHELGHLFLLAMSHVYYGVKYDPNTPVEPASSIMGIFTVLEKNEFYHNEAQRFLHGTVDDVLQDFENLHNSGNP